MIKYYHNQSVYFTVSEKKVPGLKVSEDFTCSEFRQSPTLILAHEPWSCELQASQHPSSLPSLPPTQRGNPQEIQSRVISCLL